MKSNLLKSITLTKYGVFLVIYIQFEPNQGENGPARILLLFFFNI